MDFSKLAKANIKRLFKGVDADITEIDVAATYPEFMELFCNFAFGEVPAQGGLDEKTRSLAILAVLLGCQGVEQFKVMLPAAINCGVKPEEVIEVVYQAVAYLGIGRVYPFFKAMSDGLDSIGIEILPEPHGTTTPQTRLKAGNDVQIEIFGEGMREFWKNAPADRAHINLWLADNCFGDYYTRGTLDCRQREMITFCYLYAQGGCEPQLISHAAGNMRIGNDKDFLIAVVSQCVPYIGYPRSLNALTAIDTAAKNL